MPQSPGSGLLIQEALHNDASDIVGENEEVVDDIEWRMLVWCFGHIVRCILSMCGLLVMYILHALACIVCLVFGFAGARDMTQAAARFLINAAYHHMMNAFEDCFLLGIVNHDD